MDHVVAVKHLDAQLVLDDAEILVEGAEDADDMLHPFDFYGFVDHVKILSRLSREALSAWRCSLYNAPAA